MAPGHTQSVARCPGSSRAGTARRQRVPGESNPIEYEVGGGQWLPDVADGYDCPDPGSKAKGPFEPTPKGGGSS
jgi:hypothetical protein